MRGARAAGWLALGALLSACAQREAPERLPNVVLFVADTLRADHLSTYGYDVETSPRLDAMAAASTVYTAARATAPWTLPSHASLFTGLFPFQHRAHTIPRAERRVGARGLPEQAVTLAEALGSVGYRTLGLAANDVFLQEKYGLAQGFERWTVRRSYLGAALPRLWSWLDDGDERPLFLFINAMDTHRPYNSAERPGFLPRPVDSKSGQRLDALYESVMGRGEAPDPDLLQALTDEYDTAIANLDEAFGELLRGLEGRGLLEDAVVVFTSDHGEYFGEQQLVEHSKDVYEPALHVPLIVRRTTRAAGRRVDEPVGLAQVPSLILGALPAGIRDELAAVAPALVDPPTQDERMLVLAENRYSRGKDLSDPRFAGRFWRERTVLYAPPYKWIRSSDGASQLFDLGQDPLEAHDLGATGPVAVELDARLSTILAGFERLPAATGALDVDEDELRRLEALGYR